MEDFYTIATSDGQFIYFDMGDIRYDKKLPRRSCMIGKDDAPKFIAKAEKCIQGDLDSYKDTIDEEEGRKTDPTYGWDDMDEQYLTRMKKEYSRIKHMTFDVVKVSFTVV